MSDLVQRLRRDLGAPRTQAICNEAADEIDRLRGLLQDWVNDCVCQHDSIRHPEGCGRCEDSRAALGAAVQPPADPCCNRVRNSGEMMDAIPAETCKKYAEICRLRADRHMDIEQSLLFSALTKICEQAAEAAECKVSVDHESKG